MTMVVMLSFMSCLRTCITNIRIMQLSFSNLRRM